MDFLIENEEETLCCAGPFSTRNGEDAPSANRGNGCAWARRSSKWDHLSVCHVLVSLAVERTAAAVESSSLQGHFCLVWFASDGKASNRFTFEW